MKNTDEEEGKESPKTDREEDIDPSRYVMVVESQKKSGGGEGSPDKGTKLKGRRSGGRKKSRSFNCDICREEYVNEEELDRHRKSKHINEKSEFFCDFCLKIFKTKAILKGHRYKHVTDPQFLCVRCGKKYFTISNLNEHSLYCLDEKKFECPVCYKKFNVNKQFKRHLVIHEADRYIKCTVCEQTFSRKDNYRQHFRRHTGEKPYTCDVCGKSFRIKATYNYHRRTHRDVRASDKVDASETEFAVVPEGRKEAGYFRGVTENPAFGTGRGDAQYTYGREGDKQGNRDEPLLEESQIADFPGNFLRKDYRERRTPVPYGHHLPQVE